jgi:hypothetical protein
VPKNLLIRLRIRNTYSNRDDKQKVLDQNIVKDVFFPHLGAERIEQQDCGVQVGEQPVGLHARADGQKERTGNQFCLWTAVEVGKTFYSFILYC